MASSEPDIGAKLLAHLDAKFEAGQLTPAEHESRRIQLIAEIQHGDYRRPPISEILGFFISGLLALLFAVGAISAGGGGIFVSIIGIAGFVLIGVTIARLAKRHRLSI